MNVVIAGGGTGGHLFPGIAVAQEFMRSDPGTKVVFIGSSRGIEMRVLPQLGFPLKTLYAKGFSGHRAGQKAAALAAVPIAFAQACRYLLQVRADVVLGVGGYSSLPAVAAGRCMGIPTAVHEQNSVPGLANRVLGRIVDTVFVSFEESVRFFPDAKTVVTGLPVRQEFRVGDYSPAASRFCVFVCGGSQGAHAINVAMADALPHLRYCADGMTVLHQTGTADYEMLKQRYAEHGLDARVEPFVQDMAAWYRRAHLVVCRAGASTLAELALCGRPAVLVPYPYAAGNHQELNARVFAQRGACVLLPQRELDGRRLAAVLQDLIADPQRCAAMGRNALALARPRAAADIVDACLRMAGKSARGTG